MTYQEKFEIALKLETLKIEASELISLMYAIYMGDQELVNTQFAYLHNDLENIGVTPHNLNEIIKFIETF